MAPSPQEASEEGFSLMEGCWFPKDSEKEIKQETLQEILVGDPEFEYIVTGHMLLVENLLLHSPEK